MMTFQNQEELEKIGQILEESDFDRSEFECNQNQAVLILETARLDPSRLKGGGLFRKARTHWIRCRLKVLHVKRASIWEEFDPKPFEGEFLKVEKIPDGFRLVLESAHGLRLALRVERLEGSLEDL